jgi:hypothetical protein
MEALPFLRVSDDSSAGAGQRPVLRTEPSITEFPSRQRCRVITSAIKHSLHAKFKVRSAARSQTAELASTVAIGQSGGDNQKLGYPSTRIAVEIVRRVAAGRITSQEPVWFKQMGREGQKGDILR